MKKIARKISAALFILLAVALFLFFTLPLPGTIPVLMYHYIGPEGKLKSEGLFVTPENFDRQMAFLKNFHYHVLSIEEYDAIQSGKRKPQGREVLITFDDGHISFKNEAVPILKKYGLPATMFLISDSAIKGGVEDYRGSMSIKDIQTLEGYPGISFEGHTQTHPHLPEIPEAQIEKELVQSKEDLETLLKRPVDYLAYPYGQFDRRVVAFAVKAGYRLAFTTGHKKLGDIPEGPYSMTRIKISQVSNNPIVFWYHISGIHQVIKSFRQRSKYS